MIRRLALASLAALLLPASADALGRRPHCPGARIARVVGTRPHRHWRCVAVARDLPGAKPAAPASVATPAPPRSDPLALAQAAAVEYWGGSLPCGGSVTVGYAPQAAMPADDTAGVAVPVLSAFATFETPAGSDDYSQPPASFSTCRITINQDQWGSADGQRSDFAVFCGLMVHEYGHLYGHPDLATDSPTSITYPLVGALNDRVAPCVAREGQALVG